MPAQLGHQVLASQAFEHKADLVLGHKMPARSTANILDDLLRRDSVQL